MKNTLSFSQNVQIGRGLDLFCGSGKATILLSQKGFEMQGVDISKEMLNLAIANSRKVGENIIFRHGLVQNFLFTEKYHLITAICEGINYLRPTDLPILFMNISKSLSDNGIFAFDISSSYKLQNIISANIFFEDYEDMTYIWENQIFRDKIKMNLTFFVKEKELYKRYDETHTQYIYSANSLTELLNNAGLETFKVLDGDTFEKVNEISKGKIFLVKKRK